MESVTHDLLQICVLAKNDQEEQHMVETGLWQCGGGGRLDVGAERRWHGREPVRLTATACGVLRSLVAQAGQRVSKDTLVALVRDAAFASDVALAMCIPEVRQALGDTVQTPQSVEIVPGNI